MSRPEQLRHGRDWTLLWVVKISQSWSQGCGLVHGRVEMLGELRGCGRSGRRLVSETSDLSSMRVRRTGTRMLILLPFTRTACPTSCSGMQKNWGKVAKHLKVQHSVSDGLPMPPSQEVWAFSPHGSPHPHRRPALFYQVCEEGAALEISRGQHRLPSFVEVEE